MLLLLCGGSVSCHYDKKKEKISTQKKTTRNTHTHTQEIVKKSCNRDSPTQQQMNADDAINAMARVQRQSDAAMEVRVLRREFDECKRFMTPHHRKSCAADVWLRLDTELRLQYEDSQEQDSVALLQRRMTLGIVAHTAERDLVKNCK